MRLFFIRHGDPNYKDNCLTELGHIQAEAVAERVAKLNISALYTSTYGRAKETAEHSAKKCGIPVTELDFIHEIRTGVDGLDKEGKLKYSPWLSAEKLAKEGADLLHYDYSDFFAWKDTYFQESYYRVTGGFDSWMEGLGFRREGLYYRCMRKNDDRLAIFAHGGSISCVISHLFGLPPSYVCGFVHLSCTGISVFRFEGEEGELIVPKIMMLNDHSHIQEIKYTAPQE